ncbi:phenylalanine--tRNA ligase beta subunit-related protein [Sutcliffiella horikoshii]|uniref:B3/B4 domain-containing protein n=1 Tax=Sutcliffiella horikoshii TaxID=79883 RepID=UPI00203B3BB0|nr:phenylalanine--tRNA ligase beta subunit-related protein [Sutcliffiella horikoshii]MCM3617154.1 phenylalanine--tRNA ligase beta subunit-related protein [Sutcliffiella horikoshii]
MKVIVADNVTEKLSFAKFGIIVYRDITVGSSPQMLKGRIRLFQESVHLDLEDKEMKDIPGIAEWRSVFKDTGTDPSRYRPSIEALYRRIKKGQFLEPFNSAVDLNNFFSLKYEIPFGIYDVSKLDGDVTLAVGDDSASYEGLNGREIKLINMLHTSDGGGPFGSPFVDSRRTAVSEGTNSALHVVYFKPSMEVSECEEMLAAISEMFLQVHGGTSEFWVLS